MTEILLKYNMNKTQENSDVIKYSGFICNGSRYPFDRYLLKRGFQQWDTSSDNWYFGIWVNPHCLEIFNNCEGDLYYSLYKNKAAFDAEVKRMEEFYGSPPPAFIVYSFTDEGCQREEITDNRYSP